MSLEGYSVLLILRKWIPLPKPLIQTEVLMSLPQISSGWTQWAVHHDAFRFGYHVQTVNRPQASVFPCTLHEQRGLLEENKSVVMHRFCSAVLDCLGKTIRTVRYMQPCGTAGFQMGQKIFPGSGSALRRKGPGHFERNMPPTNSWGGECSLRLMGFTNLPVELRIMGLLCWCSCHPAVVEHRWHRRQQ